MSFALQFLLTADTGGPNAYAVSFGSPAPGFGAGTRIPLLAANSNTGASTFSVDGNAIPIKKQGTNDLASGDISAGQIVDLIYDGTNWQLLNPRESSSGVSGSVVLLESHTASNSAELDFTTCLGSTYDDYQIEVIGLDAATNGATARIQFSTNGGSSYDTSSIYDWTNAVTPIGGSGGSNAQTSASGISLFSDSSLTGLLSSATPGMASSIKLFDPLNAANFKYLSMSGMAVYSNGTRYSFTGGGVYRNAAAVNAFRIIMTSGNIAAGTVRCYGVAH